MADYRQYKAPQGRHAAALGGQRASVQASSSFEQGSARFGYQGHSGKDKRKKKAGPWRFVFWIALLVFIASLVVLGTIAFSYFQGQNTYKDIEKAAGFTPPTDLAEIDGLRLADMKVDWDALKAINPDTVGWIYIPGTVVNYPLVHTIDNEKYLTTDFRGSEGWLAQFGSIFLSAENTPDFSDANNIVYGHHMNDGSMFASIDAFTKSDEFNAHRTVYILTPQGNYRLTTFSLVICDAYDPLAQPSFANKESMSSYIQDKMDRNVVSSSPNDIAPAGMEKIFAFVTCDYTRAEGRAVLFASVVESTVVEDNLNQLDQQSQEGQEDHNNSEDQGGVVTPEDLDNVENAAKEI